MKGLYELQHPSRSVRLSWTDQGEKKQSQRRKRVPSLKLKLADVRDSEGTDLSVIKYLF